MRIGRYEVLGQLATGGMAEILLARLTGPGDFARVVVVKRILRQYAKLEQYVTMFLDEARTMARIRHPNVVSVHELGEEDGDVFLVLEYVEGENLAGVLKRSIARGEPLSSSLAAWICAEACAGLHAAHELTGDDGARKNLVHRDVSPQNVFVAYDGHVKLLDFGVAFTDDRRARTEGGEMKGKFDYMSPEQAEGRPLDRRSDIFGMGIVLYELSTGRRLFKRASVSRTLDAICREPVVPPSRSVDGYPPALEAVVMKALDKDPEKRWATAADMRRALLEACDASSSEAIAERMQRWFSDRIAEKQEMLRKVRDGEEVATVPPGETDDDVKVPDVQEHTVRGARPPARSRRGLWIAGGAGLAIALLVVAVGVRSWVVARRNQAALHSFVDDEARLGSGAASAGAAVPNEVVVRVESTPPGANVSIAGDDRGTTPMDLRLPRGGTPVQVDVRRPGYAPSVQTVVPDTDQKLVVALIPAGRARVTPRPKPASTASGFRRFD